MNKDYPEMEGDYLYANKAEMYDPVVRKAYEESCFHQTLVDFEELLHKYGLDNLLGQMTTKGAYELLTQAHKEFQKRNFK